MIECNKNSDDEDLSVFADYLEEFDSIVSFDNEICGVCGVSISDTLSVQEPPFVRIKTMDDEASVFLLIKELELKMIPFKTEKRLNTEITDEINYLFNVLVPTKYFLELTYLS
ncbi:MAG: hypothetical protein ABI638_04785 [Ignavibacteriota bacterium]